MRKIVAKIARKNNINGYVYYDDKKIIKCFA